VTLPYDKPWPNVCAGLPMPVDRIAMEEQIRTIRDFINNPRRQYGLLKNKPLWFQLCSSLDVIGDTQLAIDSYEAGEFGTSDGARYLAVYGLLQALVVQQDALDSLCGSLRISQATRDYPKLKMIRDIRIESIGHPTKRTRTGKGQPPSYHFIVRMTLRPTGFQLHSQYDDGRFESKDILIPELVADQTSCVSGILSSVINRLKHEDAIHKEKFRMEKLASCFAASLDYDCRKVLEATTVREDAVHAAVSLLMIKDALQAFREALAKRGLGLDTYDCIKHVYGRVEYAVGELEEFFGAVKSGQETKIHENAAYMFAFFVQQKIEDLRDMAREIDSDYSS
jgi:hypothetical protein